MVNKFFWIGRAILYKALLGHIGLFSYLGKPLFVSGFRNIFIGKKVRIFPSSRIEVVDKLSSIIIEDNVSIGQNLHLISGCKGGLNIGKDTTISANVFITNIDHNYTEIGVHILEQKLLSRTTIIGENCFIGYGAVIQAGTILGKQCVVGANSVVRGVFPDYCVIVGAPAKIVKRYDLVSEKWLKTKPNGDF